MVRSSIVAVAALFLAGCGGRPAEKAAFTGTWDVTSESPVAMTSTKYSVEVQCDPPRFRLMTRLEDGDTIVVYDGKTLYRRTIPRSPAGEAVTRAEGDSQAPVEPAPAEAEAITPEKAATLRFWAREPDGSAQSGGQIAGRDTLLHELRAKRNDGELTVQSWQDAETGIMLKNVEAIYASQIRSVLRRDGHECTRIDYTRPPESAFQRP